jgi:hypothetical protein
VQLKTGLEIVPMWLKNVARIEAILLLRALIECRIRKGMNAEDIATLPIWDALERAVLREPVFAASYRALRERAGGRALHWLAIAPERPGVPDGYRTWFLVALPGNLVVLELLSEGARASYCFRAGPRATYAGGADPAGIDAAAAARAVARISAALVDARFLREPIALPDERLATAEAVRYRLALRGSRPSPPPGPTLWPVSSIALRRDGLPPSTRVIAWHGSCQDDAAIWPGRQSQEAVVAAAAGQTGAG